MTLTKRPLFVRCLEPLLGRFAAYCCANQADGRPRDIRGADVRRDGELLSVSRSVCYRSNGTLHVATVAHLLDGPGIPSFSSANDRASESGFLVHFVSSEAFVAKLEAAGGRIVAGTDTPTPGVVPGFSLHRELALLVQAGLTPRRAIQAATKTAAEFLGRRDELGTIEAGKLADLIIVDGQPHLRIEDIPQVQTVLKNGVAVSTSEVLKLSGRK